jgi:hypothetical protein
MDDGVGREVLDEQVMVRHLDDGREFAIIKNFLPAEELERRRLLAGLDVRAEETATYFQYGLGARGVDR